MQNKEVWTILDLIRWGSEYFNSKQIESPRLNIELMLAHVLKMERVKLYVSFDKPLNNDELTVLKQMVLKRAKHEPLQYILGETNFYGATFKTGSGVLIPRPETELIIQHAQDFLRNTSSDSLRILDIGTGSGILAVTLAKLFPEAEIIAIDVSEDALKYARENAELNSVSNVQFYLFDILQKMPKSKFDLVVSNPPYISKKDFQELEAEVKDYEPMISLSDGGDGLAFYRRFSEIFCDLLKPGGVFILEFGFGQYESIRTIFDKFYETVIYSDFANIERVVKGWLRNG